MRCALVLALLATSGCQEEEPKPSGPARCVDCENDPSCPEFQPSINPLEPCEAMDAACYYCGEIMRRFVCQPASDGELRWQDNGEPDMCPPPLDDGTAGTGE